MIGDSAFVDALDSVCDTTGLGELFDKLFDALRALCNLLNQFHVSC